MFTKQSPFQKQPQEPQEHRARPSGNPIPPGTGSALVSTTLPTPGAAGSESRRLESRATETSPNRLIVGPDVKLKGAQILDCDTLVVEGRVEATMDSRVIKIADHGAFCGKVSVDIAEVLGLFEGELSARKQLIIRSTGQVTGTIRYGSLLIEEGGEISGDVKALPAGERLKDGDLDKLSNVTSLLSNSTIAG